jgi:hypothetical protein
MRIRGPVLNLTAGNPTTAGLPYPAGFGEPPAGEDDPSLGAPYAPLPFGLGTAREAVASEYAADGAHVDPDDIILTASTSEAYGHLFTVLCDEGDEVLILVPSYPLFSFLAQFAGVRLVPCPLSYDGAWHIEAREVAARVTSRTRAIVLVSPNNPTGSFVKRGELDALLSMGLPIIVDEVFSRYAFAPDPSRVVTVAGERSGLVFSLGGLSKLVGLPQAKLAWIAIAGDPALVRQAKERLELVLDTYLNVSSFIQHRTPRLLQEGALTRDAIKERTQRNLATARATFTSAANLLHVEGGWYATLRLPRTKPEHVIALELLGMHAVYTHPGAFFDFQDEPYLILSLLGPEPELREGARRIEAYVQSSL